MQLAFSKGYKYQARRDFIIKLSFGPPEDCWMDFIHFFKDGTFQLLKGYACDGPSGLTFDTLNAMIATWVHDGGYQLIRNGLLPPSYRRMFDDEMKRLCLRDGMSKFRAWYWHRAVVSLGGPSAAKRNIKKIYYAGKI